MIQKITRVGVYGVSYREECLLLIRQKKGPYAGKFDFPGGGIEFGETPEEALKREILEEVGMKFGSLELLENLTAIVEMPETPSQHGYVFYQIGMIYHLNDCRKIDDNFGEFECDWEDPKTLTEEMCSKLLWKFLKR